jgi:hypothetical protein
MGENHEAETSRRHARACAFREWRLRRRSKRTRQHWWTGKTQSEPIARASGYARARRRAVAICTRGQVGSKPPDSLTQRQLPNDVTAQMPETKSYLFIKLPDRILLIDPDTKTVAEIVGAPATTGSSQGGTNPMNPGAPPR